MLFFFFFFFFLFCPRDKVLYESKLNYERMRNENDYLNILYMITPILVKNYVESYWKTLKHNMYSILKIKLTYRKSDDRKIPTINKSHKTS